MERKTTMRSVQSQSHCSLPFPLLSALCAPRDTTPAKGQPAGSRRAGSEALEAAQRDCALARAEAAAERSARLYCEAEMACAECALQGERAALEGARGAAAGAHEAGRRAGLSEGREAGAREARGCGRGRRRSSSRGACAGARRGRGGARGAGGRGSGGRGGAGPDARRAPDTISPAATQQHHDAIQRRAPHYGYASARQLLCKLPGRQRRRHTKSSATPATPLGGGAIPHRIACRWGMAGVCRAKVRALHGPTCIPRPALHCWCSIKAYACSCGGGRGCSTTCGRES
jgi:hypothetical protein